ncbi:hypothetical protein EDD18DRAFT_1105762 [Armillaria luteobubalina]|uniref:Uncharacterized protein n=1 Tax=Armillaria luteobubalina TaxID=153913 RepID=A0AA39Q3Z2_9AGAR|nr:hypothetical protein EDD18DRAFT_1105762 [Armillaria luteobubalina]
MYRLPASGVNEGRIVWRIAQHVGWTYSEGHLVAGFDNITFLAPRRRMSSREEGHSALLKIVVFTMSGRHCPHAKDVRWAVNIMVLPPLRPNITARRCIAFRRARYGALGGMGSRGGGGSEEYRRLGVIRICSILSTCNSPCPPSFPSNFALAKSSKISNVFCRETTYRFPASKGETFGGIKFCYKTMSNHGEQGARHRHVHARQGDDPPITQAPPARTCRHVRARVFKHRRRRQGLEGALGSRHADGPDLEVLDPPREVKIPVYCQDGDEFKGDNQRTPLTTLV